MASCVRVGNLAAERPPPSQGGCGANGYHLGVLRTERQTNNSIGAAARTANLSTGQRLLNYRCGDAEAPAALRAKIKTASKLIASRFGYFRRD